MSLVLNVEILGEFKNLTAATKGAQSQLQQMNKRAATVSRNITRAFAAIGVGLSFRVIANELEEASKAAIEDAKSQNILALAMKNTAGATADQIAQAEKAINKMQFQAGIADDKLRPAFQKLFIATKDVTESNRLLAIAMDASAATGKDLDAVSQAMAKALAGSDTALVRLIPSLKGAKDPMAELEKTFKGAAAEAANTDPYMRMQVLFGEIQEQIGSALLPVLEELSTWLATPEGQKKLGQLVEWAKEVVTGFANMAKWVIDNKDWLVPMITAIGGVVTAWNVATNAVKTYQAIAALGPLGPIGAVVGGSVLANEALQASTPQAQQKIGGAFGIQSTAKPSAGGSNMTFVTNNIRIQGSESAKSISDKIAKAQKVTGTKLNKGMF